MAVLANMREYVRRPGSLTPSYGLFKVVTAMGSMVDGAPMPVHAGQGGIQYLTHVCGLPRCFETNCIDTLGTKTLDSEFTVVTGDPFVVVTDLTCGIVGLTRENTLEFLRTRAIAGEQARVEQVFSAGDCGANPSLANSTPLATALAASANPVLAFGLLEEALYSTYGLTGVIHVPYFAGNFLTANHLIEMDNAGIWRTAAGTAVSIGNYDGTSPAGVAPAAGTAWIYITGQVSIFRTPESEVFYSPFDEGLSRLTNQWSGFREREYIVTYECGAFATETTLVVA
jgi:hypothetical protein